MVDCVWFSHTLYLCELVLGLMYLYEFLVILSSPRERREEQKRGGGESLCVFSKVCSGGKMYIVMYILNWVQLKPHITTVSTASTSHNHSGYSLSLT